MLVTGRPLIELGRVTAPPKPVYPVIAIIPLLVVYVNWASAAGATQLRKPVRRNHVFRLLFKDETE
jgi:hypothetical protein